MIGSLSKKVQHRDPSWDRYHTGIPHGPISHRDPSWDRYHTGIPHGTDITQGSLMGPISYRDPSWDRYHTGIHHGTDIIQGSLMGPISYRDPSWDRYNTIFLSNDMMFTLDDDIISYNYADDNSLLCTVSDYANVKRKLLHNANKVVAWFHGNQMKGKSR